MELASWHCFKHLDYFILKSYSFISNLFYILIVFFPIWTTNLDQISFFRDIENVHVTFKWFFSLTFSYFHIIHIPNFLFINIKLYVLVIFMVFFSVHNKTFCGQNCSFLIAIFAFMNELGLAVLYPLSDMVSRSSIIPRAGILTSQRHKESMGKLIRFKVSAVSLADSRLMSLRRRSVTMTRYSANWVIKIFKLYFCTVCQILDPGAKYRAGSCRSVNTV